METSTLSIRRITETLAKEKRLDGRKLLAYRDLKIETNVSKNADGSAEVKLGATEVIAGVKMNVGEPYPDSKDSGNLIVTLELTPLSSPRYELGPPGIEAIEIARLVDRGLRESKFIDLQKLCIKDGEKVWNVFIDIFSLNDAGNILDAAFIAAVAALQTTLIPKYDEKEGVVIFVEHTSKKLSLRNMPITMTFQKVGKSIILDPTIEEEDASNARLTLSLTEDAGKIKIHSMQKGKDETLSEAELADILKNTMMMFKERYKKIQEAIK